MEPVRGSSEAWPVAMGKEATGRDGRGALEDAAVADDGERRPSERGGARWWKALRTGNKTGGGARADERTVAQSGNEASRMSR